MMQINDLNSNHIRKDTCVALGNFDGLHLGHKKVIESAVKSGYFSVVVTFRNNPRSVLGSPPPTILTNSLKIRELESMGVDAVVELDFKSVQHLSPEEFFAELIDKLHMKAVTCGYNYHFGHGGKGDSDTLKKLSAQNGVLYSVISPVTLFGENISSTVIRNLIIRGNISKANAMLGRNFAYDFEVVHGDSRGHTLGYPTINQIFPQEFVLPQFGVYSSLTFVEGKEYKSMTNIGIRPTFRVKTPLSETYIMDFSGDLYGKKIEVALVEYMREERSFDTKEQLIAQMEEDERESWKK